MSSDALTQSERDELLRRLVEVERALYPEEENAPGPSEAEAAQLNETYYRMLAEYGDRLPRVVMSACPFTGALLKRSFDPFGLDGPWWHKDCVVEIEEPVPPGTFHLLLGALALHGRAPAEVTEEVIPGPEVPFVVPRLLALPGMVAVVWQLQLPSGDSAYPIAYFSEERIPPDALHQPWLRQDLWFPDEEGEASWLIANDEWDFDLAPYIVSGKLRWIRPGDPEAKVIGADSGEPCPYLDLPGERRPQVLSGGERDLLDLPDGTPINPFED